MGITAQEQANRQANENMGDIDMQAGTSTQNAQVAKSLNLGQYDIAIIGLGVAGSNLARLLAPHLKVIALDKKAQGGECFDSEFHKPCGGLLSEGAQAAFARQGLTLPNAVLSHPQIFAINTIDYGFPHASYIQKGYVNMERHRFDLWLKSLIPSHIEVRHRAWFKRIWREEGGDYGVEFRQEGVSYALRARLVIGADGAKSHLRRYLYPRLSTKSLVCIQEWFSECNAPMLSCVFDSELTPSYSWSMSKEGYFIFGGAYPHRECQRRFDTQLARLKELGFSFGKPLKREACLVLQPHRWRDFVRGHSGVFLIGEAAGFINASTLEGISGAMSSAQILSRVLNACDTRSLRDKRCVKRLHAAYVRATRPLVLKTLLRHYVRYPFMFLKPLRRAILRFGVLRKRRGMEDGRVVF